MATPDPGEKVPATVSEQDAAQDVVDAINYFVQVVRIERRVPDSDRLPCDDGDLRNLSQTRAFFQQVTRGVLSDG